MNNKYFILSISLALCGLAACQKPDAPQVISEPDKIEVRLGVGDDAQTKAASTNNLYGINVYYDPARDGNSDTHYAYGLFDNKEDMTITLLSGYTYKFECTMVKDGKSVLYCGQYGGNSFSGYAAPFQTNESVSTQLSNAFVYGTTYLSGITSGRATVKSAATGYEEQAMPSIQRYYGEAEGYSPVPGGIVTIPLKKTVFGVRLIVDKVPEGTLTASVNYSGTTLLSGVSTQVLFDSGSHIYSFDNVQWSWRYPDTGTLGATVNWSFTSSVFDQWNQTGSETVRLKRNTLTTITVSCTPDNASGNIITQEEDIGENRIYLYLNSDGVIVIGIEPNPEDDD